MNRFRWLWEVSKYSPYTILRFWWNGRDFLEERRKWVEENKRIKIPIKKNQYSNKKNRC
jgi:hypothetical protein